MKTISLITAVVSYILISCIHPMDNESEALTPASININANIFKERFSPPDGFARQEESSQSFETFLRNLPLKPDGSTVTYYDGSEKSNSNVYAAVVDLPIGKRDLHQCADAVMRLRADYLYNQKRYSEIHFNFTNGFNAEFTRWANGERISVNGNNVSWKKGGQKSYSIDTYWKYLEMVFSYAGTASLEKELKPASVKNIRIGDVFIRGGFPGHAVIVIDKCKNSETGKTAVALAQSYMPAQEIQVLRNPQEKTNSIWYYLEDEEIITPEWTFSSTELRQF